MISIMISIVIGVSLHEMGEGFCRGGGSGPVHFFVKDRATFCTQPRLSRQWAQLKAEFNIYRLNMLLGVCNKDYYVLNYQKPKAAAAAAAAEEGLLDCSARSCALVLYSVLKAAINVYDYYLACHLSLLERYANSAVQIGCETP